MTNSPGSGSASTPDYATLRRITNIERTLARMAQFETPSGGGGGGGVPTSRQVIAGDGLTGGGALTSDVTLNAGEGPGIDITADAIGLGGDSILIYHADLSPVAEFVVGNLDGALAACVSGDIVILPLETITGDHTIPANVSLTGMDRVRSILTGKITLLDNSLLYNLYLHSTTTHALCVECDTNVNSYVYNCNCLAEGSASAFVAFCNGYSNIHFRYCTISALKDGTPVDPFMGTGDPLPGQPNHYYAVRVPSAEGVNMHGVSLVGVGVPDGDVYAGGQVNLNIDAGDFNWITVLGGARSYYVGPYSGLGLVHYAYHTIFQYTDGVHDYEELADTALQALEADVTIWTSDTIGYPSFPPGTNIVFYTNSQGWPFNPPTNVYPTVYDRVWAWCYGSHEPSYGQSAYVYACEMPILSGIPEPGDRSATDVINYFDRHSNETVMLRHHTLPTGNVADAGKADVLDPTGSHWVLGTSVGGGSGPGGADYTPGPRVIHLTGNADGHNWTNPNGWHNASVVSTVLNGVTWQVYGYWDADTHLCFAVRTLPGAFFLFVTSVTFRAGGDGHNALSVGLDRFGFIHVSYDQHDSTLEYRMSTLPVDRFDGSLTSLLPMLGTHESSVTYPGFINDPDMELYFFFRDGTSNVGDTYFYKYNLETLVWEAATGTGSGGKLLDGATDTSSDYYWTPIFDANFGDGGKLHLFWAWNQASATQWTYIAYVAWDGTSFFKADGTAQTVPILKATSENVVNLGLTSGQPGVLSQSTYSDSKGHPHLTAGTWDSVGMSTVSQLHHIWYDGSVWHNDVINANGTTAWDQYSILTIDRQTDVAYVAYTNIGEGNTWLYQLVSKDPLYATWDKSVLYAEITDDWYPTEGDYNPKVDVNEWERSKRWHIPIETLRVANDTPQDIFWLEYTPSGWALQDALRYPSLHANDKDVSADSLHHSLGTGHTQAAAGDHTHPSNNNYHEIIMQSGVSHPPVPIENSSGTDWLYSSGISIIVVINTQTFPIRATLWHQDSDVIVGNQKSSIVHDINQNYIICPYQSVAANGDTFVQSFEISDGTYTLNFLGAEDSNNGLIDWYLDNVLIASGQDWYAAGPTYNVFKSIGSLTISNKGRHILKGVANGKNISSSGYYITLTKYWFSPSLDTTSI